MSNCQPVLLFGLMSFSSSQVFAENIPFKENFQLKPGWIIYLLAILTLAAIYLISARKNRGSQLQSSACLVVDKKRLSTKTTVYILDYQNQRFLLAENQHALVFQQLNKETHDVAR
ncbi:hypothetical protein [Legionella micdadei]|uniref:Flagellar biosynthetic protein FliO n=1 Tax=Legionella micdadei TaxID=451 RepID=A0A098GI17_LEGMI|nr:hypothetical protein [Legionella micdadei]ARG96953.1 hypothetical protein B6N58_04300 [Legionella micdadei]ARH00792.1 hypothetical protein B6V88_10400 [Legionella micdadei]KTD26663.1 hypothetical protein Lmic_2757 [Legionella micdadei]NSL19468.1 hypothetical protein [Legionella micdadei]CEG61640.1 exported protein of unknown function [Legionella micdadei]